jgi:hypothetical protein
VNIEYVLGAPWDKNEAWVLIALFSFQFSYAFSFIRRSDCTYEVNYEGSYWFLHDVTCLAKNKKIQSGYRWTAIQQFWTTLRNLTEADKFLVHLTEYSRIKASGGAPAQNVDIPDSVRRSYSLFVLSPDSKDLVTASENSEYQYLSKYWKQICLLDINVWHKWMHTHRINLILKHDLPLPEKFLHEPNSEKRFFHIQCLKSMSALSQLLRDYTSFVLLENHSYIKFMTVWVFH